MQNIVVIGGSSGAIEALREILRSLPAEFEAAVFVVIHLYAESPTVLPRLLSESSTLPVVTPSDGDPIEPRKVYIARPDFHLVLERGHIRVWRGPKENRHRPSIDALFRSAARSFGARVAAVLLSGTLDDGVAGLQVVKANHGVIIVQDPNDAVDRALPDNAMRAVSANHIVPAVAVAAVLSRLQAGAFQEPSGTGKNLFQLDSEMEREDEKMKGNPSMFTCPECNGTLWELDEGGLMRFRCRVGHAYSSDSMEAAQSESLETALWSALRSLEENVSFHEKFADGAAKRGLADLARRYRELAGSRRHHADLIRTMLLERAV